MGRPGLRLPSRHMVTAMQLQRQGSGEVHHSSRLVEGLGEGAGALQDVPGASSTDPSLGELKGLQRRPESASYFHLPDYHPLTLC